jgi:glycosyltransferase involved in cell wall biosynthesis
MKIVYYIDKFPKLSESFILNEIFEMEKRGHQIAVCSLKEPDDRYTHGEINNLDAPIQYLESPSYSDVVKLFSPSILKPTVLKQIVYIASPIQHAANLFRAKKCIQFIDSLSWDPDHIHTHFATSSKFGAQYAAKYFDCSFTLTAHAFDIYRGPSKRYKRTLMNRCNRVITISQYNKEYIRKKIGTKIPIDVIHAGIRPQKFKPNNETAACRILTISRLVEKKGIPDAIKAVDTISEQVPNVEYHIIGSGDMKQDLIQLAENRGLMNNIQFLDNVSDQKLVQELDQAQVFLLPCVIACTGDRDGIPVSLMEAMAMKTPPVSTNISGIPELIDHRVNGLLAEARDPQEIAKFVLNLLQNNELRSKFGVSARKKVVSEFNVNKEADKLENSFKLLI